MLSFLKSWFGGKGSSVSRCHSRQSVLLTLESLEDRFVPSTLNVTSTAGTLAVGTLPYAVKVADADAQAGRSDTIVFAKSLQGATINLSNPLEVTAGTGRGWITIDGNGTSGPKITGKYGAFDVAYGTVAFMNDVYIRGCNPLNVAEFGAITNEGSLVMNGCELDYNNAYVVGGAIDNNGILKMTNCYFNDNLAQQSGGAIYNGGAMSVDNCSFNYNYAGKYGGGAIYNDGTLVVTGNDNVFTQNQSFGGEGGAMFNSTSGYATVDGSDFVNNTATYGGAIASFGHLTTKQDDSFVLNHASYDGGGVFCGQGSSYSVYSYWRGNTAGVKGPDYYLCGPGGKVTVG